MEGCPEIGDVLENVRRFPVPSSREGNTGGKKRRLSLRGINDSEILSRVEPARFIEERFEMRPIRFSNSDRAYSIVDRERIHVPETFLSFFTTSTFLSFFFSLLAPFLARSRTLETQGTLFAALEIRRVEK